jgi:hypothetical protein
LLNPVALLLNPVALLLNPVAQLLNPVTQLLNPVAQLLNPVAAYHIRSVYSGIRILLVIATQMIIIHHRAPTFSTLNLFRLICKIEAIPSFCHAVAYPSRTTWSITAS